MIRKAYQTIFPTALAVVVAAFLTAVFLPNANLAFAAASKKKAAVTPRMSAVEHTEARIKQLQDALKITPEQEGLWNNLTTVMRENARDMDAIAKERSEKAATLNAVDHLKLHLQITEAHLAELKKFIPSFEALYASMSDEQKKTTDAIFLTGRHGKKRIQ